MIIKNLIFIILKFFAYVCRIFPINNSKIVFINFNGKGYGDNLKPIAEELLAEKDNHFELIWLVKEKYADIPKQIKQIKWISLKGIYTLATAKIWISNERLSIFVRKRKSQIYFQTWHSSIRLKKIEKDAIDYLPKHYINVAKNDSKMIDYITCGCEFSKQIFANSFWYNGPILMYGTPKLDIYFNNDKKDTIKNKLKKELNISSEIIILYAPTFRNNRGELGTLNINQLMNDSQMKDYVLLYRAHPGVNIDLPNSKKIINVSKYPDIQELIILCDILITDYSSCCFDTLFLKKPCILYIPDVDNYLKNERSLYFQFDELPFIIVKKPKELKTSILNLTQINYMKKANDFLKKIGSIEDGTASKKTCKKIKEIIYEKI